MLTTLGLICIVSATLAQNTPTVVCVPGKCLQGFSNTTIGAELSAPGAVTDIHLLPGQYAINTNPQLLHNLLTSSSATLSPSSGFNGSLSSFPLDLELQPGLAIFAGPLYSGESGFSSLPITPLVNQSVPLTAQSLSLSQGIWISTTSAFSNQRTIIWDSVPNIEELPPGTSNSLSLVDIQSSGCSPPCASSGICSSSRTCQCATGFAGASCESCATGFFGPQCQPCPGNCGSCDEGITGSGRCLKPIVANAPSTCNCLNGVCGTNGQCSCNAGFVTADNGTLCAKCAQGFFLTSSGDCKVCQLGCTQCNDGTGACNACKSGFSQDPSDSTKCLPPTTSNTAGVPCPSGSFGNGAECSVCSPICATCTGGTSSDCIICASGKLLSNGACVSVNQDGICSGSNLIGDNVKKECDACDAKCTSCKIPNFNVASTVNFAQCTGCLPGFVLSNGSCIDNCPSGSFVSPTDNLTCTTCDSSCSTCAGSSTFCLSCANNQLASGGKCVSNCPSGTFSASGSCLPCHPDCSSCSGGSFNQCSSCPPGRPVLSNGRCLPTCGKVEFYDATSSSCQFCDVSCSSCSGAGPSQCLACSSTNEVLRVGTCVSASCTSNSSVVLGLGACLSDFLDFPTSSSTSSGTVPILPPLPTITGINSPTTVNSSESKLQWWQILLMVLGCAFILLVVAWLWHRRARRRREEETAKFVAVGGRGEVAKMVNEKDWRRRLMWFGMKHFGHLRRRDESVYPSFERRRSMGYDDEDGGVAERGESERVARVMESRSAPAVAATAGTQSTKKGEEEYLANPIGLHIHGDFNATMPKDSDRTVIDSSSLGPELPPMYSLIHELPHPVGQEKLVLING